MRFVWSAGRVRMPARAATLRRWACSSILLVTVVLAFGAPSAFADNYCVGSPPACTGTTEPDLQAALNAAAGHAGQDQVFLGAGAFTGEFTYNGSGGGNSVVINGAGPAITTITADGLAAGQTGLTLTGDPGSAVANLTIGLPAQDEETGLYLGPGQSGLGVNVSDQSGTTRSTGVTLQGGHFFGN